MSETWTIDSILRVTKEFFEKKGIESARLDAELLLAELLGITRVQLYTQYDRPLSDEELDRYRERVRRRGTLEPVAYILGEREFYGRTFAVAPGVLVPRPETEHLIDAVLEWAKTHSVRRVLDVGTGSGCIAVTLACELPNVEVVATDVEPHVFDFARGNAETHGVAARIQWQSADIFPEASAFDVIASNPPYIALEDAEVEPGVQMHEPRSALFAGADGLDVIRRLVAGAADRLERPGLLAFELGARQREAVESMLPGARFVEDLQGHPRIALREF